MPLPDVLTNIKVPSIKDGCNPNAPLLCPAAFGGNVIIDAGKAGFSSLIQDAGQPKKYAYEPIIPHSPEMGFEILHAAGISRDPIKVGCAGFAIEYDVAHSVSLDTK